MWKKLFCCRHSGCHFMCSYGSAVYATKRDPCPDCGRYDWMYIRIGRWVSDSTWWNPFSWFRGHYEFKG